MNIAFAGFRHDHIFGLYEAAAQNSEVTIVGAYEEDAATREKVEREYGIHISYNHYDALLNDDNVQAVAIGDYYGKRGAMVIEALKHGKHVICDKPICTSLEELNEIEKLAEEKQLQVCCMLDLRYMPQIEKVKALIEAGDLGDIHIASFTGQHCLNYGVRPQWYFEEGKHGGTINDIAIHGIDLIRYITGKNLTKINYARVWNAYADKVPEFKDCGQFNVDMDGMALSADVSYAAPAFQGIMPTYWDFCFWGTKGMLNFNLKSGDIRIYRDAEEVIPCDEIEVTYLTDFIKEISGTKTIMNTKGILLSQRQVLQIQDFAFSLEA